MNTEPQENRQEVKPARPLLKYAVTFGVAAVCVFLVLITRGLFDGGRLTERALLLIWSDALFIVGMLTLCIGGLLFVTRDGAFDGLGYAARSLGWLFNVRKRKERLSFHEYKLRKSEKRRSFLHLVVVGSVLLVAAAILNIVFDAKFG